MSTKQSSNVPSESEAPEHTSSAETFFTQDGKFKRQGAAAAAKSLQSCPTLCDSMDSSPPGSSVHRIL